jgi:glucosamine-6-phosphate deaminase
MLPQIENRRKFLNNINLISTIKGSHFEDFYPKELDLERLDACCSKSPADVFKKETWWHDGFKPVQADSLQDFNTLMGLEIALQIKLAREEGRDIIVILSAGPMGMYRWAAEFLNSWNIDCSHIHGFNMDEWSDSEGNTLPASNPGAFRNAMEKAFYGRLNISVPQNQRHFATRDELPRYPELIADLKGKNAKFLLIYGIGWIFHIAFWEPQFAADYSSMEQWKQATHRIAAKLHPMTIIQNSITSFKGKITSVPARANTIGPGIFLQADYTIGGVDGYLPSRNMMYQSMALWATLKYGPDMWVPSSIMPQYPGKLFFIKELAGPLNAEVN